MLDVTPDERRRAEAIAKRLGVRVPRGISLAMWPLEILEALIERLDKLEAGVERRRNKR